MREGEPLSPLPGGRKPDIPPGARWGRMRARLERALRNGGLGEEGVQGVLEAHDRAGLYRAGHLPPDEEDPRWLHPGRVLVILLDDAGVRDPAWLALGAGMDLARPHLMEPGVREALAREGLTPWPDPGALEDWTTEAVLLPPEGLALLLADALDRFRHLHLEPPGPERARIAQLASTHFLPLAERVGGTPARRFRWWCRRVAPGLAASRDFDSS